jgi:hypothetical protein
VERSFKTRHLTLTAVWLLWGGGLLAGRDPCRVDRPCSELKPRRGARCEGQRALTLQAAADFPRLLAGHWALGCSQHPQEGRTSTPPDPYSYSSGQRPPPLTIRPILAPEQRETPLTVGIYFICFFWDSRRRASGLSTRSTQQLHAHRRERHQVEGRAPLLDQPPPRSFVTPPQKQAQPAGSQGLCTACNSSGRVRVRRKRVSTPVSPWSAAAPLSRCDIRSLCCCRLLDQNRYVSCSASFRRGSTRPEFDSGTLPFPHAPAPGSLPTTYVLRYSVPTWAYLDYIPTTHGILMYSSAGENKPVNGMRAALQPSPRCR